MLTDVSLHFPLLLVSLQQYFSAGGDFAPQETLATSGDVFGCHAGVGNVISL